MATRPKHFNLYFFNIVCNEFKICEIVQYYFMLSFVPWHRKYSQSECRKAVVYSSVFHRAFPSISAIQLYHTQPSHRAFRLMPVSFNNRLFEGSGHMVRNKLHWDANNAVGLPKQRNSYNSSRLSFVLEVPLRHLRPSVIYSVPCDWILQRAYCLRLLNQVRAKFFTRLKFWGQNFSGKWRLEQ